MVKFGEISFWWHSKKLDFQSDFFQRGSDSSPKKKQKQKKINRSCWDAV